MTADWTPPEELEETAKRLFVPPQLYIRYRYAKELRKGEREIRLVPFLADPRRAAIDVGANKGVYTYALLQAGVREVHAFEPNPKLFGVLERWARGKARLYPAALSDTTGEAVLMVPHSEAGYSNQGASLSADKLDGQDFGGVSVRTLRLDEAGIADVGFIKIDVEGFEMQVLKGAAETLRRDRPTLLVEIEEKHTKRRLPEMIAEVCAYGYQCLALRGGVLTPFAELDLAVCHDPERRADYIFNFVFLPVSR
jgi:FkbM family methyltransferase